MSTKATKTFSGYYVDPGIMRETPLLKKRDYDQEQRVVYTVIILAALAFLVINYLTGPQ
jgi:hypothetical protein